MISPVIRSPVGPSEGDVDGLGGAVDRKLGSGSGSRRRLGGRLGRLHEDGVGGLAGDLRRVSREGLRRDHEGEQDRDRQEVAPARSGERGIEQARADRDQARGEEQGLRGEEPPDDLGREQGRGEPWPARWSPRSRAP